MTFLRNQIYPLVTKTIKTFVPQISLKSLAPFSTPKFPSTQINKNVGRYKICSFKFTGYWISMLYYKFYFKFNVPFNEKQVFRFCVYEISVIKKSLMRFFHNRQKIKPQHRFDYTSGKPSLQFCSLMKTKSNQTINIFL